MKPWMPINSGVGPLGSLAHIAESQRDISFTSHNGHCRSRGTSGTDMHGVAQADPDQADDHAAAT
jgi:hypothetical protein